MVESNNYPFLKGRPFWHICSRQLLKMMNYIITQNEQFCILPQCLQLFYIYTFIYRVYPNFSLRYFQGCLLQMYCMWERVKDKYERQLHCLLFCWGWLDQRPFTSLLIFWSLIQTTFDSLAEDNFFPQYFQFCIKLKLR